MRELGKRYISLAFLIRLRFSHVSNRQRGSADLRH